MEAGTWRPAPPIAWVGNTTGAASFARYEGMPTGTMTVNEAVIESTGARFSNGTIEFDIKPLGYNDAGIIFRRHGTDSGEFFYLRANPDCPAANDCIQYAPITHTHMQWDIYADMQRPAQISPTGWNHVRLVVAGEKMLVFINRETTPALVIPKLQGLTKDGGIAFKGPAIYANLTIRSDFPAALPEVSEAPPEPGTVTTWDAAAPTVASAPAVLATDIPGPAAWHPIAAEATGLVNLTRAFARASAPISTGWLRMTVTATADTRRAIRIGWARQVSVFLNGRLVFSGVNPYRPSDHRLSPDGRLEADNASIPLDLRKGRNEIVLAVGDSWLTGDGIVKASPYGWAAEAHFDDLTGIALR
ncbi:hypothetical protein [Lichenicola sp.]|uniref:hypothetical protein n=1 Tax=Lichenicola sp. TaxID=2804529 RepID=UPI003AFFA68A